MIIFKNMETAAIIWFWGMLIGAMSLVVVGEKQAANPPPVAEKPPQVVQVDGGWKKTGDGDTEVRVYWDK